MLLSELSLGLNAPELQEAGTKHRAHPLGIQTRAARTVLTAGKCSVQQQETGIEKNQPQNQQWKRVSGSVCQAPPTNNSSLCPLVPATAPQQSLALNRDKLSLLSAHKCWEKTLQGIP